MSNEAQSTDSGCIHSAPWPVVASYGGGDNGRAMLIEMARRGIGFLLTREQFEAFCHETGYHLTKGRTAEASSIDRIKGDLPYQAGNIQLKTVSANSIKSWFDGSRDRPDLEPQQIPEGELPW